MSDNKLKLAKDTIRLLLDTLVKPVTEATHIERMEAIEAGEKVYSSLKGVK